MPDQQENIQYPEKLVAFIDILGFKSFINDDFTKSIETIKILDYNINTAIDIVKTEEDHVDTSINLFSDCMCISCEYNEDNIYSILYKLAYLQLYFSISGIFIRGGLSIGNHFENNRIIFSAGLIRAYEIEKIAIYPRIVVDTEIANKVLEWKIDPGRKEDCFLLRKSPDGLLFIDYLSLIRDLHVDIEDMYSMHKRSIINQITELKSEPHILDKYRWVSEYHNGKVLECINEEYFGDDYAGELVRNLIILIERVFPKFEGI